MERRQTDRQIDYQTDKGQRDRHLDIHNDKDRQRETPTDRLSIRQPEKKFSVGNLSSCF